MIIPLFSLSMHVEHGGTGSSTLIETIFPEEEQCPAKLTSALIKLVCHPYDKLSAAALSFVDVGISKSSPKFTLAMATTELLPQLFDSLKPHEIPINGTTIEFHRKITSIVNKFLRFSSWNRLSNLEFRLRFNSTKEEVSKLIDPIIHLSCAYLRHLLAPPVCRSDNHYGFSLLTKMTAFVLNIRYHHYDMLHSEHRQFLQEARKIMMEEFASSLGLATKRETLHELLFGEWGKTDEICWTETFENIVDRLSEGRSFSDLGLEALKWFLSNQPRKVRLVFTHNEIFSIEEDGRIVSSMERPTKSLCAILTPARLEHAAVFLAHFYSFTTHLNSAALFRDIKSGWFSDIFAALTPSKLPFTNEYISLHTSLIYTMKGYLVELQKYAESNKCDQFRSELNVTCHSFVDHTRDYLVYLSLHPFALIARYGANTILDFFTDFFGPDFENSVTKPIRDEMRKEMDAAALSSPSPPFILTSDIVCRLTDDEIMNVVDRIVALLESDSPIDDDAILRICAFDTNQLKCVYLPELFRKAGRSTEQYFHALNSLLSLPFDYYTLCPIKCLLTPKPKTLQPEFDEWDDVDLLTVGVVMPTSRGPTLIQLCLVTAPRFCCGNLASTVALCDSKFRKTRHSVFLELSRLCEQRVIAQCLSRLGFFSRIVCGLLDDSVFNEYKSVLGIFLGQTRKTENEGTDRKAHQRTVHHCLEEGWQDVLDFLLVRKNDTPLAIHRIKHAKEMIQFLGANCQFQAAFPPIPSSLCLSSPLPPSLPPPLLPLLPSLLLLPTPFPISLLLSDFPLLPISLPSFLGSVESLSQLDRVVLVPPSSLLHSPCSLHGHSLRHPKMARRRVTVFAESIPESRFPFRTPPNSNSPRLPQSHTPQLQIGTSQQPFHNWPSHTLSTEAPERSFDELGWENWEMEEMTEQEEQTQDSGAHHDKFGVV
ncbi:hypothetical protein BLNAU_2992 [Blattamonas nauphoetae]|uniref:Uncharacterized protein n=1 Tax=Blattamonas nauphoetae TaxID=2049346 RepID=A0ABQ9YDT4_9EUKA|nr:hypothetical protein BLNAU_2992 [Blattamonas nauphoetae]